jgi:hypothetical protein
MAPVLRLHHVQHLGATYLFGWPGSVSDLARVTA